MRLGKSLEEEERLPDPSFDVSMHQVDSDGSTWRIAVVSLPAPEAPGEAHFVGLAVRPSSEELSPDAGEADDPPAATKYVLLEADDGEDGQLVVEAAGELERTGTRVAPERDSFVETLHAQIDAESSPDPEEPNDVE